MFFFLIFNILASDIAEPILTENRHTVCFGELGCFSSLPPFHPDMPLPLSPKRLNTKFYLYTRQNREPEEGYFLEPKENNIMASQFDPTLKTKIIIHGFVVSYDLLFFNSSFNVYIH